MGRDWLADLIDAWDLAVVSIERENTMSDTTARRLWEALDTASKVVEHFQNTHNREPSDPELRIAASLFIEASRNGHRGPVEASAAAVRQNAAPAGDVACGQCGGAVFDNRAENAERVARGEKPRPELKCKDQACGWVKWPPKGRQPKQAVAAQATRDPFSDDDSETLPF